MEGLLMMEEGINVSCGLDVRQSGGNMLGTHIVTTAHCGSHAICINLGVHDKLRQIQTKFSEFAYDGCESYACHQSISR